MTHFNSRLVRVLAMAGLVFTGVYAQTPAPQGPPAAGGAPGQGPGGRGGRGGGLPGATPEQTQAVADMNTSLTALTTAATAARNDLATVAIANVKNDDGIRAAVDKLRAAELAVATARADAFAKLQASPNKLNAEQVTALINMGAGGGGGRGGGGRGGI